MIRRGWIIAWIAMAAAAPVAEACSVCFGKNDSAMTQGLNMGIFALLLVITAMLALISTFFVFIARRGAQLTREQNTGGDSNILTKQ